MIKTSRQFFQICETITGEESITPMQLRPVNFPVEDGQLLTQREILCRERCWGHDQARMSEKRAETRTINVKQTIGIRMSRTNEQNG
jgi:hypothetical protein